MNCIESDRWQRSAGEGSSRSRYALLPSESKLRQAHNRSAIEDATASSSPPASLLCLFSA